jgi:hypothetical protein
VVRPPSEDGGPFVSPFFNAVLDSSGPRTAPDKQARADPILQISRGLRGGEDLHAYAAEYLGTNRFWRGTPLDRSSPGFAAEPGVCRWSVGNMI